MKIFNVYKYLYYRSYSWFLKIRNNKIIPHLDALGFVSVVMFLNAIFIVMAIDCFNILLINSMEILETILLYIIILILLLNYIYFILNKRYLKIFNSYSYENKSQNKKRGIILLIFVFLSIVRPFILSELIRNS